MSVVCIVEVRRNSNETCIVGRGRAKMDSYIITQLTCSLAHSKYLSQSHVFSNEEPFAIQRKGKSCGPSHCKMTPIQAQSTTDFVVEDCASYFIRQSSITVCM